jgi:hypothetical protein
MSTICLGHQDKSLRPLTKLCGLTRAISLLLQSEITARLLLAAPQIPKSSIIWADNPAITP